MKFPKLLLCQLLLGLRLIYSRFLTIYRVDSFKDVAKVLKLYTVTFPWFNVYLL